MQTPWFSKYAPASIKEVLEQPVASLVKHAVTNPRGKALLICGPAGSGKTISVKALADGEGYELIEVNASSVRDSGAISSVVGNASLTRSLFGKRVILVDDIDSLGGSDRGGIAELIKCIKETRTPIFLTAIDPWDVKLRSLKAYCEVVEFKKVRASTIRDLLKRVCIAENVKATDAVLYQVASHANGDVRAAINNLEMLAGDGEVTEYELEAMGYREKPVSIFNGLQTLFKTTDFKEAIHSLDDVDLDFSTKMLWITENITSEFTSMTELASAFNYLSRADVFNGRISKWQYWRFLVYVNALMTVGVSSSRESSSGFIKYKNPSKILKLWQSKSSRELRKELALKLKPGVIASTAKLLTQVLPYIKLLAKNKEFADNYGITPEELKVL